MNAFEEKVKRGFLLCEKNGVKYLTIPSFTQAGFEKHLFTTRVGGVSSGCYESLNLSRTRENSPQNKEENYRRVCGVLDVPYEGLALVNYAHGDGIYCATRDDAGKGITRQSDLPACDAMIIREKGITAVTLHADCVPVFFADMEKRIACVSHAGWRGVYQEISGKVADVFVREFGSKPQDLIVGIGPHIMQDCFEVQADVAQPFCDKFGGDVVRVRNGKTYVSLQRALLRQLYGRKIPAENITCADLCTYSNGELFYSHRRDNGNTGAMGSFIAIT